MSQVTQKVVVTGGAGFIGGHLVARLLETSPAEVVVVDNLSTGRLANLARPRLDLRLSVIEGDIRNPRFVGEVLRDASVVFHLAGRPGSAGADHDLDATFSTNVVGTFNLVSAAARCGVGRLVFASSRHVYGEPLGLPVDENHPLLPIDAFGASTVAAEAYCRVFRRYGLQATILRLANVYGVGDAGRVVADWLARARVGQELLVHGETTVLDFISVDLAVESLLRAAASERPMPPINVGSGTGTRLIDLARRIVRLTGSSSPIRLLAPSPLRVSRFVANVERMRELLGINPPLDPFGQLDQMFASSLCETG
jgi:UDP-glucose 4-epimerase